MWLLLLYPLLLILLFAGCAALACRLLDAGRLGRWPPLLYGGGAFLLVHGVFILTPFRGVLPLALPFIALVLWGTLFFQWWPWSDDGRRRDVERAFFLSMLAAGLYVVVCLAFGALLFWLEGPPLRGGG